MTDFAFGNGQSALGDYAFGDGSFVAQWPVANLAVADATTGTFSSSSFLASPLYQYQLFDILAEFVNYSTESIGYGIVGTLDTGYKVLLPISGQGAVIEWELNSSGNPSLRVSKLSNIAYVNNAPWYVYNGSAWTASTFSLSIAGVAASLAVADTTTGTFSASGSVKISLSMLVADSTTGTFSSNLSVAPSGRVANLAISDTTTGTFSADVDVKISLALSVADATTGTFNALAAAIVPATFSGVMTIASGNNHGAAKIVENIYLGNDNVNTLSIFHNYSVADFSAVSRMRLEFSEIDDFIDTTINAGSDITWSNSGVVSLSIGSQPIPAGIYYVTMIVYDQTHDDGQVIFHESERKVQFNFIQQG